MKKFSLHLLLAFSIITLTKSCFAQLDESPVIRFGLIADIQYANVDTRGTRFYRSSLEKLEDCIQDFNSKQVPFIINLGDVTDRNPNDLDSVLYRLKRFKRDIYTVAGNHDYHGVTDNAVLYKRLGMPEEYYSFKKGAWRFIMLNTNEVASYANVSGTWKQPELDSMMARIKARKGKNGEEYNGGISSRQLAWLTDLLKLSESKGEKVLIFSHHPFACAGGLTALNDKEVLSLVSQFKCVKALIAGHHHEGAYCEAEQLPCIVAEGMVETADKNSYGIMELYADKLVLTGYGRMTSRIIHFKK